MTNFYWVKFGNPKGTAGNQQEIYLASPHSAPQVCQGHKFKLNFGPSDREMLAGKHGSAQVIFPGDTHERVTTEQLDVDPILINLSLFVGGCHGVPGFSGESDHFWRGPHPPNNKLP